MPHVKGNKFKPKVVENEPEAMKDAVDAPLETVNPAADGPPPRKKLRPMKPIIPTVVAPLPKAGTASKGAATSNWESLKAAIQERVKNSKGHGRKRKGAPGDDPVVPAVDTAQVTRVLALDCEMVGVGKRGDRSILARVCVINSSGAVVYDSFVAPSEKVTDYRTKWSGVRPANLKGATLFEEVKAKVQTLLRGRILIGHAVHNDLEVLGIQHPEADLRDTSRYPPLMKMLPGGRIKPRALRHLAEEHLALAIQSAEHCPKEDARAALGLYQKHKKEWEKWLAGGGVAPKVSSTSTSVKRKGLGGLVGVAMGTERLAELARSDYMADL